jgi:hypothetical protein
MAEQVSSKRSVEHVNVVWGLLVVMAIALPEAWADSSSGTYLNPAYAEPKEASLPVFISPHYYYPHDRQRRLDHR